MIAIEAMMMNKPVVCYIRDDIWQNIKDECPIFNANPDNLYDTLKWMTENMEDVKAKASKGRDYVSKYHDAGVIAKKYLELFQNNKI